MDSDNPAILYFRRGGVLYRVKAFVETVWIERQLNGDNLPYSRADHPVFDGLIWNFDVIDALVKLYQADTKIDAAAPASAGKSSRCTRHGKMSR